jgi:dTDP-4-dehydrorhamnose 3,5-epimerase
MEIIDTKIKDVKLIKPKIYGDSRGFFLETYHKDQYEKAGISVDFLQDNHSRSKKNILRGLHYQLDKMQGKLVRVSNGCVYDVAVDMREGSPTFKEHVSFILSDENQYQLYIPPGFAHGFCVISDNADFEYKCTEFYNPNSEVGIMWNDPDLGIDWPVSDPIVSDKDNKNYLISEIPNNLIPKYL